MLTPTTVFESSTLDAIIEVDDQIALRWWEAKVQRILESTNSIKDIQFICKYIPFEDLNARLLALSKKWKPRLDIL